jgi:hypothetical protein
VGALCDRSRYVPVTPFDFDLLAEVLDASASAPILLGWLTSAQIVRALTRSLARAGGRMHAWVQGRVGPSWCCAV